MIARAELESRDGALARISMWRAGSLASVADDDDSSRREPGLTPSLPAAAGRSTAATVPRSTEGPESPAAEEGDEEPIVVNASRRGGCRVGLADRTLTERELAETGRAAGRE